MKNKRIFILALIVLIIVIIVAVLWGSIGKNNNGKTTTTTTTTTTTGSTTTTTPTTTTTTNNGGSSDPDEDENGSGSEGNGSENGSGSGEGENGSGEGGSGSGEDGNGSGEGGGEAHVHVEETIPAVDATCENTGLTEGKRCSSCGTTLVEQQETPKAPHTYDNDQDEECNKCGHVRDVACAHANTEVVPGYEATCEAPGLTNGEKCKDCGEILVEQTPTSLGAHDEEIEYGYGSTCKAEGLTNKKYCSECGTVLQEAEPIPVIDCSPGDWIEDKEASYTEEGHRYKKCTMCGETLVEETIPIKIPVYSEGLEFTEYYDYGYQVSIGTCTDSEIVIPSFYNGQYVVAIAEGGFKDSNITSVEIPESIKIIRRSAFENCESLTSVILPESTTYIDNYAFSGCIELTEIYVPDSVTWIGPNAFAFCFGLAEFEIPASQTKIWGDTFYYCTNLKKVTIHVGVTHLYSWMFDRCEALEVIHYEGTMSQWEDIWKDTNWWNGANRTFIIKCTDGTINIFE